MDLEVLNLKVEAQAVERATRDLNDLDTALDKVDRAALKLNDTNKVLRGEQLRVAGSAVKLSESLTKTQAGFLATMKQAGASAKEIGFFSKQFENMNKIMGLNTFDKSANALARMRKQTEELTKSTKYIERYNDLTKQQISLLTQGIEATRQRAISEQKNFGQREAAVKKFIKEFVKEAQAYNTVAASIEEKNRVAREEIRLQQESARAAQVSAKQRADAEKYVQETLQRTLFMNEQMDKGMSTSGANALYAYKQQLDLLGLSADQATAKMQEFQSALSARQGLQGKANPINQLTAGIRETTQEVNQLARAVSVQLGDVFVSLAGGMNPLLVAIQQGDQIRFALEQAKAAGQGLDNVMRGAFASMANSFVLVGTIVKDFVIDGIMSAGRLITNFNTSMLDAIGRMTGLGNVASNTIRTFEEGAAAGNRFSAAMVGVMNVSRILAGGLLLGIVAAIGTFAVASVKLSNDLDKLSVALNMSGASLGLTAQQAQQAAEKIGDSYGTSIYDALDAVTLFATKNIQFTDEMIVSATELSRVTGKSLSDIIDSYSSLKGKPVEGLLDVAIATGQVNIETIKQIDKLNEQGETAKAVQLAMEEKARAEAAAAQSTLAEMTPLGKLWVDMKRDVSELGDAVYDLVTKSVLVDVFAVAWKGVASVFHVIAWAVQGAGKMIGGIAAQLVALANLDFSGVMNIGKDMMADAATGYRNLEGTLSSLWKTNDELTRKELEAAAKRREESSKTASEYKKEYEARKKGADEAGKEAEKTQKYFEKLMEGASDLALKTQQEVSKLNSGYEQMTNSQKMLFDAQNDPRWNSLSERQKLEFENALKLIQANEELIRQYNAQVALQELLSKWVEDYDSVATSIKEEVAALKLRNDLLFKTEDEAKAIQRQYDLNVKLAAVENKYIERRNQMMRDYVKLVQEGNWSPAALEEYQRNMAAVTQQEAIERELAHKDANLKIVEDYEERFREIQETITDIIATALFEGGKAGSKKLKDVLKAEFRKYVIKVFIEPVVGEAMGMLFGKSGSSGGASSGGSSGFGGIPSFGSSDIGGSIVGMLDNAAISAFNNGWTTAGDALYSISNTINSANTALKGVPGFEGGVSSVLGYGQALMSLSDGNYGAALGQAIGTFILPGIGTMIGGFLGGMLGWNKKPSDKTSAVTVDLASGNITDVWDMGGKKAASKEQKDANTQFSQLIAGFASLTGITGRLVTAMGARDGIRVAIEGGFNTPQGSAAGGVWLGDETAYSYGSDPATAAVKMMEDLLDEGTLSQAVIDSWTALKITTEGVTKDASELIGNLALLVAGYDEESIRRADLLQQDGEAITVAYARMLAYEKALSGTALPGDTLAAAVAAMGVSFERLNVTIPTSVSDLNNLILGIDMTTEAGQQLYVSLMNLVPGFLELGAAQESLYNQLIPQEEMLSIQMDGLNKAFIQLGVTIPKNKEELRALIDAQDTSTVAGAELRAQLLALVPAFIDVSSSVEEVSKTIQEALVGAIDSAYDQVKAAGEREKAIIESRIKSLNESLTGLNKIFDFIKKAIDTLTGATVPTSRMRLANANSLISSTARTGVIRDSGLLEEAVSVAVTGVESSIYASRIEQERATILLINNLSKINTGVKNQISSVERSIRLQEDQLSAINAQLEYAKAQVDAAKGINTSVLSLKEALDNLAAAILGLANEESKPTVTTNEDYIAQVFREEYGLPPLSSSTQSRQFIPQFESGGAYSGGLALVGESGPELINFNRPGMVYNAAQTSSLMTGDVEGAIDALRQEVVMLRAETRAVASNTSKSAKLLDRAMPDGQSLLVTAA